MEKVFPADRHSGVAIAGAAGPAVEMVKLFQLQLEHYEKVEGAELSLEGKANQLGQMVRSHLPAAMQGFVVVPLFAGYDLRRGTGRLFEYDVTGGRYEESDFAATGSGSLHAGTVVKLGYRPSLDRSDAVELVINSLFQAADEDSATGGPDLVRGIYPVGGHHHGRGLRPPRRHRDRRALPGVARPPRRHEQHDHHGHQPDDAGGRRPMSMPFYVPAEQLMKDKADFAAQGHRPRPALVALNYADGILICAENSSSTLRKVSEIYDRIAFAGAGKYNEYDRLRIAGVRHADLKGYSFSREDVDAQSLANAYAQMLGDVFTHEIKPMEVEIVVAELGADPSRDRLFHILYDGTVVDEQGYTVLGGEADAILERVKASYEPGSDPRRRPAHRGGGAGRARQAAEPERARGGGAQPGHRPPVVPPAHRRRGRIGSRRGRRGGRTAGRRPHGRGHGRRGRGREPKSKPRHRATTADRRSPSRQGNESISRRPTRVATARAARPTSTQIARDGRAAAPAGTSGSPPRERLVVGCLFGDDLAGHGEVVLGHQHDHRADRVGPVHVAAELPHDALGAEMGRQDARLERARGRRQRHHGPDRHGAPPY